MFRAGATTNTRPWTSWKTGTPTPERAGPPQLVADLRASVRGEVRFSNGDRAIYSTDASNYRQLPIGAVVPRDARDVIEAIGVCHRAGVPVLARGVGTSLAGQTCNTSVVLDHRHAAASEHGLNFGLDPASLIVPRPERASRFWPEAFGLATWIRRHA